MRNIIIDLGKLKNIYTGLGEVSWQFGKYLAARNHDDLEFTYLLPANYVNKFGTENQYRKTTFFRRYFPGMFHRPDLWHALHQDSAYMPPSGTPYLLTIHDLNFLREKGPQKAEFRLKKLQKKVDRATAIAFISGYVESEARSHLRIEVPTRVIYNGVASENDTLITRKPSCLKNNHEKIYFCVGVIKEKKNFHVLIDLMEKLGDGVLVIAGDNSDPYARKMMKSIELKNLGQQILMPGIISRAEKSWLYKNCEAFFFPSRIEGFGLPVIEAMSYGKPVFLSKLASLPEIAGEDGYYWEDFHPEKMQEIFINNLKTMNQPARIEARKKRAAMFSWDKNVDSYLDYYRFILDMDISRKEKRSNHY